jgi:hypothetical protein
MLELLIDNIFVMLGGRFYQHTVSLLKKNEKKLGRSYNFMLRYIDDVISLNNSNVADFADRI